LSEIDEGWLTALKAAVSKGTTRAILSVGSLAILGFGVYTEYFTSEQTFAAIMLVFAFWFGSGKVNGGDKK